MLRLQLKIAYTGTQYNGWQVQNTASHCIYKQPTIQNELEKALSSIAKEPIKVYASGRTDSGVHAEAQVAHCDVPEKLRNVNWQKALNINLPHDIRIRAYHYVPETFHARFNAVSKIYTYRLWCNWDFTPPRLVPFVWTTGPLALEPMLEAAAMLVGKHDFAAFQNMGTPVGSTERTVFSIQCTPSLPDPLYILDSNSNLSGNYRHDLSDRCQHNLTGGCRHNLTGGCRHNLTGGCQQLSAIASCQSQWSELLWHIEADGFLKQMVRNIMGLLVWVGKEKIQLKEVSGFLAACKRTKLGCKAPTAPANGLTLTKVLY